MDADSADKEEDLGGYPADIERLAPSSSYTSITIETASALHYAAMSRRLLKFSGGSVVTRASFRVRRPFY